MAVVIRKRMLVGGVEVDLKTYQPSGGPEKKERERADKLDKVLAVRIPQLADTVVTGAVGENGLIRKWYLLGEALRAIVEDQSLVSDVDVGAGLVWQAIWHYLPDSLKPTGSNDEEAYSDKLHKRKDHLSLSYEIAAFKWNEVRWIQRWDDWHQLAFRPGLLRDPRILSALGEGIGRLETYPTRETFREIVKRLGDAFPTRRMRDSSLLPADNVSQTVNETVRQVVGDDAQGRRSTAS